MSKCFTAAVDIGTSSVKLVMYDDGFGVLGVFSTRSPLVVHGDTAVQDAERLAELFTSFVRRASLAGCRVTGVSVYRGSMLAWDADGHPVTDVVTWLDRRSLRFYERLPLGIKALSSLPVIGTVLRPGSPALIARMLLSEPNVRKTIRDGGFLWSLDSFLAYILSKRFVADVSQATLTGLINPYTLKPIGFAIRLLGLKGLRIPELLGHDVFAARFSGVDVGPFIADQQAAAIGLGCLDPGCLKVTMGTGVFVDKPVEAKPPLLLREGLIPVVLLAIGDTRLYGVEGFASGVGLVYDAFAEALGGFEKIEQMARIEDVTPALVVPALAGLRTPYKPYLQGALLGVSPGFKASSLAKGLVLGTALLIRHIYSLVTRYAGKPLKVRIGGGLSRLNVLVEWVSSALDMPVERSVEPNDSARGAALLAAYAAGLISRKDLYNPPLQLEQVEGSYERISVEAEVAWRKLIDVLGSKSFSKLLARILG